MTNTNQKGFTLIELLVVIGIIAVLSVVVLLTLNPAELLRQARDSTRISDLSALNSAINLYATDVTSSYSLGDGANCYVDVPTGTALSPSCDADAGATYAPRFTAGTVTQVAAADVRDVDATGWIPVNFNLISSGTPISRLPVDPSQSVAGNRFYAYRTAKPTGVCTTGNDCTVFEVNANMESTKFSGAGEGFASAGGADVEGTDGGSQLFNFEVGTRLNL